MKKRKIFIRIPLLVLLTLTTNACGKTSNNSTSNEELFTITWKNYDGNVLEVDSVKKDVIPTYDGVTPTKPNDDKFAYTWSGWTPEITKATQDQTYTAVYSSESIQYEITYNLNGGINDPSNPTTYTFEDNITFNDPTKAGYTFLGWFDESGKRVTSIASGHTGLITLNASWNEGNEYALTLDSNGGTLLQNELNVQYGHEYSLPAPEKLGYIFDGWYDKEEKVDSEGIWSIDQNKILVAKWTLEHYQIVYHLDGGTNDLDNPKTYTIESETITFKNATKAGYSFVGWYDYSFANEITSINKGSTEEVNLFAKWEAINYKITYDLDGGDNNLDNPTLYTVEDEIQLLTPTKTGYAFVGWYSNEELISVIETGTTGDLTLKAKWTPYKNGFNIITEDMEKGAVEVISGSGYTDETIIIKATPIGDYVFDGWYKNGLIKISGDATYTFVMPSSDIFISARFISKAEREEQIAKKYGTKPILSSDGKTLTYGLYPQTNVDDQDLINALNELTPSKVNGWYLYNEEYYAKVVATPYSNSIQFSNGNIVVENEEYWFKCELIEWKVLTNYNGEIQIITDMLLDMQEFYSSTSNRTIDDKTIYPSNYEHSTVRTWLNNEFYNTAFALNDSYIQTKDIDNSKEQGMLSKETYVCNNTEDKVFLLSAKDYVNGNVGFPSGTSASPSKRCLTTDYARAKGIYYYPSALSSQYCGHYWTRSPSDTYQAYVQIVNVDGSMVNSNVDYKNAGVRPSIVVKM